MREYPHAPRRSGRFAERPLHAGVLRTPVARAGLPSDRCMQEYHAPSLGQVCRATVACGSTLRHARRSGGFAERPLHAGVPARPSLRQVCRATVANAGVPRTPARAGFQPSGPLHAGVLARTSLGAGLPSDRCMREYPHALRRSGRFAERPLHAGVPARPSLVQFCRATVACGSTRTPVARAGLPSDRCMREYPHARRSGRFAERPLHARAFAEKSRSSGGSSRTEALRAAPRPSRPRRSFSSCSAAASAPSRRRSSRSPSSRRVRSSPAIGSKFTAPAFRRAGTARSSSKAPRFGRAKRRSSTSASRRTASLPRPTAWTSSSASR